MTASSDDPSIRVMQPHEYPAMRALAVAAFGGDQTIGRLLDELRASWAWIDDLCFVADDSGEIVGQVLYVAGLLDTPAQLVDVLVLSPLSVHVARQHEGIGQRLVQSTLAKLDDRPEPLVFVEGHPDFYPRFGFTPAAALGFVAPSVRIPADAFMVRLLPNHEPWMTGALVYPDAFWRCDAVGLRPDDSEPSDA